MSLGPAGLSLNPEQAENFEDVCNRILNVQDDSYLEIDGEAVCRQRSAFQPAPSFRLSPESQVRLTEKRLQ